MERPTVRDYATGDVGWAEGLLDATFGGRVQARRGELIDVLALPGLVAEVDGHRAGFLTYELARDEAELAVIVCDPPRTGVGTALVERLRQVAAGRARIWLVTTNDNLDALRFYQRRGFRLHVLRTAAADEARRRLKPSIPEIGEHGIPIRDELELELHLR